MVTAAKPQPLTTLRRLLRGGQRLLPEAHGGLLIVAYHLVDGETTSAVDISTSAFRQQLEFFRERAQMVTIDEAVQQLQAGLSDDRSLVAITFDDAYRNFYDVAWPILCEFDVPSTLYVPVGFIEGSRPAPLHGHRDLAPLDWATLREMLRTGTLQIGSHSREHRNLARAPSDFVEREATLSRRILEQELQVPIRSFCYPQAKWSRRAESVIRRHYDSAVIGGGQRVQAAHFDPWRLTRTSVRRDLNDDHALLFSAPVWLEEWLGNKSRALRR